MNLYLGLYAFFIGLAIGSFLNVCIYRIPLKKSIVRPPSSCPNCGKRIRFYENIPLISYLFLKGKCHYCRHPISWQYPMVEILVGFISLFLFIKFGINYQYILSLFFISNLLVISLIDMEHMIIPDVLSLPGILLGWAFSFIIPDLTWTDSLIGILAGGGGLYLVAIGFAYLTGKEGMGGGDIKLLAMIGAWMGWRSLPLIILMASLSGLVIGFSFMMFSGKGLGAKIPFGPYLSLGAIIYFFFGFQITHWYMGLMY